MQPAYARNSMILFGVSILLFFGLTVFESKLVGIAQETERVLTFALLVLPAAIGSILGVLSLVHKEGQAWLAVAGIILNTLFALFHILIILFAG